MGKIRLSYEEAVHYHNCAMLTFDCPQEYVLDPHDPESVREVYEMLGCGRTNYFIELHHLMPHHAVNLPDGYHQDDKGLMMVCEKERWPPVFWLKTFGE